MRLLDDAIVTNYVIREVLGEKHPIALGWQVLIETYDLGDNFVNKDGTKSLFERPDIAKDRDQFQMGIGRVLMLGSAAFKGPKFVLWDIIPEEGDYVLFPKYEGTPIVHNLKNIQFFQDYNIIGIVPDPSLSACYHNFRGI
jgi:co-chaperonin GroES (HSP10)